MSQPTSKLSSVQKALSFLLLSILALPFLLPLLWTISTSLKGDAQIYPQAAGFSSLSSANLFPHPVQWSNYTNALTAIPLGTYLGNTLFLCVLNVFGSVFSSAVVAYGFARLRFKGRDALFMVLLATLVIPSEVTMIPVFVLYSKLGWYDTYLPLTVPSFCGSAFFIFLFRQFFLTLPEDFSEAARMEGATEWAIFWKIVLPLSKPVIATCALFAFLGTWNDFMGPLLYLNNSDKYTLAYGLQQFQSQHSTLYAQLMAATTLFTLPIIILFFLAQKTFIQGIATTGGKG